MHEKRYIKNLWPKIDNREYPYFDIVLEIIEILQEAAKINLERYSDSKSVIYRTITLFELGKRLKNIEIEKSTRGISRIARTFFIKKKIDYIPLHGGSSVRYHIKYTHKKLMDLEDWAVCKYLHS